jgi:MoxR-like ATPase
MVEPVLSKTEVVDLQAAVTNVRFDDLLLDYLLQIVDLTRKAEALELGISPRGALALFRSAQALALIEGRDYCIADDVKRLVLPCFAHRVLVNSRSSGLKNRTREAERILQDILQKANVPI